MAQQQPLVSGRWLLWSLTGIFGGGLALVYLTSVLLFWQGQWQILFHPNHPQTTNLATIGLPIEDVAFDATESGKPQLDGWFIPAPAAGRYAGLTVLYLHSMKTGSLPDAAPELAKLYPLGVNVFAFDYQGFGKSHFAHPSEQLAAGDTEAAWVYLTDTRHLPPSSIVLDGTGLAASLAAEAAARHPESAGVVLDDPAPTALELLRADTRSRWMPVRLLAHDRFDPGPALATLKQPELFLLPIKATATGTNYTKYAAAPRLVVYYADVTEKVAALRRFLDELHQP